VAAELRVCIDARMEPSLVGGVAGVMAGLVHGLSRLEDGDERYLLLTPADGAPWLEPHVGGAVSFVRSTEPRRGPGRGAPLKRRVARLVPGARRFWRATTGLRAVRPGNLPRSDGTVEAAKADVVHFVAQSAFLTDVPNIYQPHDLQHIHLPEHFTRFERRIRDVEYRAFCENATTVAVTSTWVRDDVIRHFGLPPEKVAVVPWAPPTLAYESLDASELERVRSRLRLPPRFLLYPARAWPHKNHLTLFRALARLRDESSLRVQLVCTGGSSSYAAELLRHRRRLGLDEQILWLGFVTPTELRALFDLCDGVVLPTLFEAASGPMWEAFLAGAPVACSAVTSLPAQAGDAALLFDPRDEVDVATAVRRIWSDEALRVQLAARGRARVELFTWERTAKMFRAHYRRIAGRRLDADDAALLAAPPLL
jgi:glycosyltransferase involved in cell wall biosynthesis